MISIIRRLEFDAGHRVFNHESKCSTPHGHRYIIEIKAHADALDSLGRIIDFSILKDKIGSWLDEKWDHAFLIFKEDASLLNALKSVDGCMKQPFICEWNPTAENMAEYLLKEICPKLLDGTGVWVSEVVVYETPNCKAIATK